MAGITLEQAQAQLNAYLEAETKVLSGQAYIINGRKLVRADLQAIQDGIKIWNDKVVTLTNQSRGSSRSRTIIVRG